MSTTTNRIRLIDLHDDELLELIRKAQEPLLKEISALKSLLLQRPEEALTVADVAQLRNVSTDTVRRWITRGVEVRGLTVKLKATPGIGPNGGRSGYRIEPDDFEAFLKATRFKIVA